MPRATLHAQLDVTVRESRITLIQGLPRVGRSELVRSWTRGREDVVARPFSAGGDDAAPLVVFDHLSGSDVDAFVARFRAAELAQARTRFLVLPIDLDGAERLRAALAGSIRTLDVDPPQLDDALAEGASLSEAGGPQPGAVASASPTNAPAYDGHRHWLRGGLPESLSADSDRASLIWRRAMLADLLGRDYSRWDVPRASPLPEILRWVANENGGELDDTACPIAKRADLRSALYVFDRLGLTRRLSNYPAGSSASLARKPKLYIRDSGLLHSVLGIETVAQLRDHVLLGESWEGYCIEALIAAAAGRCSAQFYRIKGLDGEDEVDLVLDFRLLCGRLVAIECKASPDKNANAGFHIACEAIGATDRFVVHSGPTATLREPVDRLDLPSAIRRVSAIATG